MSTTETNSILIKNCSIFNFHDLSYIDNANIEIEGNKIKAITESVNTSVDNVIDFDSIIDATGKIVVPGLTNAHSHTAMTLLRGSSEDLNSSDWFNKGIWIYEQNLEPDFVYLGTLLGAAEMLLSGTTYVCDHYFYMDKAYKAYQDSGMRADLAWAVFGRGKNWEKDFVDAMDFTETYRDRDPRLSVSLGPHSPYICPENFLKEISDISAQKSLKIHIHVSEKEWQVEKSLKEKGVTPIKYLYDLGLLKENTILAHASCATQNDLEIIKNAGALVGHAAKTYMKFGFLTSFLPKAIEKRIKLSFASDGPASNNTFSIFEAARDAALLCKLATGDAETCRIGEIVPLLSGLRSIKPKTGIIKEGYLADLLIIDRKDTGMIPEINLPANFLYSINERSIDTVIVDGKIVVEEGKLLNIDMEYLMKEIEKIKKIMIRTDKDTPMQQYGI